MWCNILTKRKQGLVFRELRGHLINIPTDYDNEAEHLLTHPILFSKQSPAQMTLKAHGILLKSFIERQAKSITFRASVEFAYKNTANPSRTSQMIFQRAKQKTCLPLKYHRSVLNCKRPGPRAHPIG